MTELRRMARDTLLEAWGETGVWRQKSGSGFAANRTVVVKVQWNSRRIRDLYSGSEFEGAEVYMSRDESDDATFRGVANPAENSLLILDSEPDRPLVFKGEVIEKSPERIKIVMERRRRITTGGGRA